MFVLLMFDYLQCLFGFARLFLFACIWVSCFGLVNGLVFALLCYCFRFICVWLGFRLGSLLLCLLDLSDVYVLR